MTDTGIQEQLNGGGSGAGADRECAGESSVTELHGDDPQRRTSRLEDCVDGRGGSASAWYPLRPAAASSKSGALRMTETYGAALLAEEMEAVCKFVANLRPGKGTRGRSRSADPLHGAATDIRIERLLGGGRDIALVLLPILNDLRAARGQPLLSEGTLLLLLNLSPSDATQAVPSTQRDSGEDPVFVAKQAATEVSARATRLDQGRQRRRAPSQVHSADVVASDGKRGATVKI